MGVRKLILKRNKTLNESDKIELAGILSAYDIQTKRLAYADDIIRNEKAKNELLESRQALYENCIADMAGDMALDMRTEDYYIERYKNKWNL